MDIRYDDDNDDDDDAFRHAEWTTDCRAPKWRLTFNKPSLFS